MKKITAVIVGLFLLITACAAPAQHTGGEAQTPGPGASDAAAEESGQVEEPAAEESGTAATGAESGENRKPELVLMNEEETDYSRAAQSKKGEGGAVRTSSLLAAPGAGKVSAKNYTVMIYIVGSNLESRYGAATSDIREMQGAGVDFDRNNVLIYAGGSKRWNIDISNQYNSVLDLSSGEEIEVRAKTQDASDMGTPQTLSDFINFCTDSYPAEHYGLILWNHGAGPLWGYGSDELFGNDSLLLQELRAAMEETVFGKGRKLDWVGFDACLMGSIENADLWKDYAGYLVGSEELESGRGWDYSFLRILNETDDPQRIVSAAVDAYGSYYEENRTDFFNPDVTLSALDLSRTDEVLGKADALFAAMTAGIGDGQYALLNQARERTKRFGLSASGSREQGYDLLDLRDFADKVSGLYPEECGEVREALDRMVVRSTSNVSGAGGVSIYLPGDNQELYGVSEELYLGAEPLSDAYKGFVGGYMDARMEGINTDWSMPEPVLNGDELTLQLTEDQVRNSSRICYTILNRNSFGGYAINTAKIAVEPDENNVLHIPADPYLLTWETDMEDSPAPLTCLQTESADGESVYMTLGTYLIPGHEFKDVDIREDEDVVITVKNTDGEKEAVILDITSSSGSALAGGKESVDVSHFESVVNAGSVAYYPERDEDGNMKPFNEWKASGYEMFELSLESGFRVFMKRASQFDKDFICQVTIRDVNGNQHGSEYVELDPGRGTVLENVPAEKGTLQAKIYADHAEITGYEGEDEAVTVPAVISGKPVTVIGDKAFAGNLAVASVTLPDTVREIGSEAFLGTESLEYVQLPEGLKSIGIAAFRSSGIKEIAIPDSVEEIKRGAFFSTAVTSAVLPDHISFIGSVPFGKCTALKEIRISGDNPDYKTVDGALYTEDGRTLIQYPCGAEGSFQVAGGTETIRYGAFAGALVEEVTFPSTLRTIENMAFYECRALAPPHLPDSLESVGDLAFGEYIINVPGLYDKKHVESVHIGPNVRYIGRDAFCELDTEAFAVDPRNEQFASAGGFITSRAGDMILEVPRGIKSPVRIPDGITTLQDNLFADCRAGTEFVIPDSAFRFGEKVFPYTYGEEGEDGRSQILYQTRLHCAEDAAAARYAKLYDIPFDTITDPEDLVYEEVKEELQAEDGSGAVTLVFHVFRDRAELTGCGSEGDGTVVVPSQFRDLPVTAIRKGRADAEPLYARMTKMVLPDTVREIEWDFFTDCRYLKEIEADEKNTAYKTLDGVLYSGDGKILIGYPADRESEEFIVPDKVETIGEKAFYINSRIRKITMPRSLRTIQAQAFSSCEALRTVEFNKGLKEIGNYAFSSTPLSDVSLPSTVTSIGNGAICVSDGYGRLELPAKLQKLGYGAFTTGYGETFVQDEILIPANLQTCRGFLSGILFERFAVEEENGMMAEKDGLLMSRDGTTLYAVPTLRKGDLIIPEGTLYIGFDALEDCDRVTDIYLPDSVLDIGDIDRKNLSTGEYLYTIHCKKGSEAQKKLDARGISWQEW